LLKRKALATTVKIADSVRTDDRGDDAGPALDE
jgi:hypothetical protein